MIGSAGKLAFAVENQTNPRWRSDYGGKFKWKNILSSAEGF
jgi:hypothetical protein